MSDVVIVEKELSCAEIARLHEQQALSYLKATGLELAIVINFGAERVQSSRVVCTKRKVKNPYAFRVHACLTNKNKNSRYSPISGIRL